MPNLGEPYIELGRGLRTLRKAAGLTQIEASKRIRVSVQSVSMIERAERGIRWATLLRFLAAYEADLHSLADAIQSNAAVR
jgi:transcriptional regulator with XRE-family HTH domain